MAWTSQDQNPSMSPSAAYGQTNYAATLNNAAYYNPMGSGGTMAPSMAPVPSMAGTGGSYADQLNAMAPQQPWETRETSKGLSKSAQRPVPANISGGSGTNTLSGGSYGRGYKGVASKDQIASYIQEQATARGIDPVYATKVYRGEGYNGYVGDAGKSFGPFQLYTGGGIGNRFIRDTGLDPSDPNTWKEQVQYSLNVASQEGWGPWHGRPGGRNGPTRVGLANARPLPIVSGSVPSADSVPNPHLSPRTSPAYGAAGARGPLPNDYPEPTGRIYGPAQGGQDVLVGGDMPTPRMRPQRSDMSSAYAPSPETMDQAPFDAVLAASRDRRPQPPTPPANPRRDQLQAPAPAPATAPEAQGGAYVVKRGDNLSRIAQRELGDPNRWREIAQANGLRNPNVIQPGQRLVIPGQASEANVPAPRMRPSREVDIPTPRPRPTPQQPGPLAQEPAVPWLERQFVDGKARPGPVIPRTSLEKAQLAYRAPDRSLAAGGNLGTPETQMSLDASARPPQGTPVYGNEAAVNRAGKGDRMNTTPAGPGMDTSGLIREPTAGERALQGGARMPLPTGPQPMNPVLAEQIKRTPVVIVDPRSPPVYVSPAGVRIWAAR